MSDPISAVKVVAGGLAAGAAVPALADAASNGLADLQERLAQPPFNVDSSTINDLVDEDGAYANHGAFVAHVRELADRLVADVIAHLRGRLRSWMRPRRVGAGWRLWPARARASSPRARARMVSVERSSVTASALVSCTAGISPPVPGP